MTRSIPATSKAVPARKLLQKYVPQRLPFHKMSAEISVHWEQIVVIFQRICGADSSCFIPVGGIGPADDLPLFIETEDCIITLTREPHEVVQLESVLVRQCCGRGCRWLDFPCRRLHGLVGDEALQRLHNVGLLGEHCVLKLGSVWDRRVLRCDAHDRGIETLERLG